MGFFQHFTLVVLVLFVLGVFVERGEAQGNGIKHLKVHVTDLRRRESVSCFPKDFSSDLDPDVYRQLDRMNYATGFLGQKVNRINQNELYDCDDTDQLDIDVDAWGCDLITSESDDAGLERLFSIQFTAVSCNNGLDWGFDTSENVQIRYYEQSVTVGSAPSYEVQVGATQDFVFGLETVEQPIDTDYQREQSVVIGPFGPPEHQVNIAEIDIPLKNPGGAGKSLTVRLPIRSYNPCLDLARCMEALISPGFDDVSKYMCPVPLCAPGWYIYNAYGCYQELRKTPESPSFPANEAANFETFSGVYDCTARRVDDAYCFSEVNDLAARCASASIDGYAAYS